MITHLPDFTAPTYRMTCGASEAEELRYRKAECSRGVWLISTQENAADNVYFHNPKDKSSDGFGGATLKFTLEDGSIYAAKGPWKTFERLLSDTGIDLRDKFLTRVVVGTKIEFDYSRNKYYGQCVIRGVVYIEDAPVLGKFDRYRDVISALPPGKYAYWYQTNGMTSSGYEDTAASELLQPTEAA